MRLKTWSVHRFLNTYPFGYGNRWPNQEIIMTNAHQWAPKSVTIACCLGFGTTQHRYVVCKVK